MNTQICDSKGKAPTSGRLPVDGAEVGGRQKARRLDQTSNATQYNTDQNEHKPIPQPVVVRPDRVPARTRPRRRSAAFSADSPDLRRRARREYAEMLVDHAAWLTPEDRELVTSVFGEGLSVAAYARRRREKESPIPVRTARRRLRKIVARLLSPRFVFVIENRKAWPATRRRAAMACVVQGLSLREAAAKIGVSLHAVRRHMDAVEALYLASVGQAGKTAKQTGDRDGERAAGDWR